MADTPTLDWTAFVVEQLTWHWDGQLRPRLDGLTDEESAGSLSPAATSPWPPSSCTSTARSSATAPRSLCSETCARSSAEARSSAMLPG